jgi:hypothetical protein
MSVTEDTKRFSEIYLARLQRGEAIVIDEWSQRASLVLQRLVEATRAVLSDRLLEQAARDWRLLESLLKALTTLEDDPHFPGFVEAACTSWWDEMTSAQLRLNCGIAYAYRAMPAYILAMLAFRQRDRGASMRWASLGYIADATTSGIPEVGGNHVTLRFGLGVSDEAIGLLNGASKPLAEGYSPIEGLPEWRLTEAVARAGGLALIAPSSRYTHHASKPFVRAAVAHALVAAASNTAKGERLEHVAAFLTTTVPGMRPRLRLKTKEQSAEHDVVAAAVGDSPYPLPERASEWLIECKNWNERASAGVVGHFLAKMMRAGSRFGLLIAKAGITRGKSEDDHAEAFRRDFCLRHQVYCLVIGADELHQLGERGTFRGLIDEKYEADRFGASLGADN